MKSFRLIMILLIVLVIIAIGTLLFFNSPSVPLTPHATNTTEITFPVAPIIGQETVQTFDEILEKLPTPAFEKVLTAIHLDLYKIIPCTQNGQSESVLLFTAKYTQDPKGNNFNTAAVSVKDWEPYVLKDIGQFIFPGVIIPENTKLLYFTDIAITNDAVLPTSIRRAAVSVGELNSFIYYGWVLNYILFSSSQSCLEKAMSTVYPLD